MPPTSEDKIVNDLEEAIEFGDLDYVRANTTMRRYSIAHVSNTSLEEADVMHLLERLLRSRDPDSVAMTLNGPILLVLATESEHEQITQVLVALALNVQR